MSRLRALLLTFIAASTLAACDEKLTDLAGPSPNLTPTFSSIQTEIFNTRDSSGRAACIECHNTAGARFAGGMSLVAAVSYQSLVGVASTGKPGAIRVIPGDPDNSYILKKLLGSSDIAGERMPRGAGPFLTDGQIRIIRRWIELGAKND
jgi:hypothetical protein